MPARNWQVGDKQPRLFRRAVLFDKLGNYEICVMGEDKKTELARLLVKAIEQPFHPWSVFLLRSDAVHKQGKRESGATMSFPGKGIALPKINGNFGYRADGWRPWQQKGKKMAENNAVKQEPQYPLGKGPLPKLVPEKTDPDLKLTIDQDTMLMRISSKTPIETCRPDWHFLCRWWVNGKPVIPEHVDPLPKLQAKTVVFQDDDVLIELTLSPNDLKAQRGDQIELQLLYTPEGWLPVKNPLERTSGLGIGYARLSNKVSFKL